MDIQGKSIIFSAPSGSGKTTLVQYLLKEFPQLEFSISSCSRAPRGQEKDGVDYHFLGVDGFKSKIAENAFLEYEEVYENQFYGTLKSELLRIWNQQNIVIFDVDVVGGKNIKELLGDHALAVFIAPPSIAEMENRLRHRATDNEEQIQKRVAKASFEMEFQKHFDAVIVNDDLNTAKKEIKAMVEQFIQKEI